MEQILKAYGDRLTIESATQKINDIKERFSGGVTAENVSVVLILLMNEVGKYKKLTGSQKKTLVTKILTQLVLDMTSEKEQPALREIIQLTVPQLIDNFIDISKGLELRDLKKKLFCC